MVIKMPRLNIILRIVSVQHAKEVIELHRDNSIKLDLHRTTPSFDKNS